MYTPNKKEIMAITYAMRESGLSKAFVDSVTDAAFEFEGISTLIQMWQEEVEPSDRAKIIADLEELLVDIEFMNV